ncbi:MAG: 3-dehydroquinate synthase [Rikenellaceae bacterium]
MYTLNIKGRSDVMVDRGLALLESKLPTQRRIIVITDQRLDRLYGKSYLPYERIIIGEGEGIKTLVTVEQIMAQLIEMGADRKIFLLGFGGGIVTDITGFVGSTYLRGVDFGFISTTLLSQVDAGVGGKNGVNLGGYKNMVGTFNQPLFVLSDIELLSTLSDRDFRAGIAEIIKGAIICDPALFELLEGSTFEQLRSDKELIMRAIIASINIKAKIVDLDERESGERRKLNLGHTFAHAIEKLSTAMNHGEAVAVGTVIATQIAQQLGLIDELSAQRVKSLHDSIGFDINPPLPVKELLKAITKDKKVEEGSLFLILPTAIGNCEIRKMTFEQIASAVETFE